MTARESVDGVFLSYYEDIDRWHNDHAPSASGVSGSPARLHPNASGERTILERTARQAATIDGEVYDLPRFLSLARYGSTLEYRRWDAFSITHLSGKYYQSLCRRHGFDVRHVNHVSRVDLEHLGRRFDPRFVFLSSTFMTEAAHTMDAMQQIRRAWPGVPVVVGGLILVELEKSVPPPLFQRFLKTWGADVYVVSPQGEEALLALLEHGGAGLDSSDLRLPASWVRRGKTYAKHDAAETGLEIDDNYVRWDQFDSRELYPIVHTRTARSCAFVCAFCSYFSNQGPLVLAQPETLERELELLTRAHPHVHSVVFTDDTFNVPLERFRELLKVIRKFGLRWFSFFRAQYADDDLAAEMADSGCGGVMLGIESLDDRVLKNMQKAATRKAYSRGIRNLKAHGIPTHANFIIGFPGDVAANTRDVVEFIDGHGVDFFCATPWFCSPATPIHARRAEFGVEGEFYRWKHDTMDVAEAMDLEEWIIDAPRSSVFITELAARNFWTELLLYSNGYDVSDAQELVRAFNRFMGRDTPLHEVLADPAFARLQALVLRRPMPDPPGSELYRSPDVARELNLGPPGQPGRVAAEPAT
jgi:p-methyltransferase